MIVAVLSGGYSGGNDGKAGMCPALRQRKLPSGLFRIIAWNEQLYVNKKMLK